MDTTAQLILLAKRTLREFRALGEIIRAGFLGSHIAKNVEECITPQQTTTENCNRSPTQPLFIPNVRRSLPKDSSADRRKDHPPFWKKIIEWGALLTAIGLLVVNSFQSCSTRKAADAAKSAAETAKETLIVSERPWVGISANYPINIDRLQFILNGLQEAVAGKAEVSFALENFGNSPAIEIAPFTFAGIPTEEAKVPEIWRKIICTRGEEETRSGMTPTIMLMPKATLGTKSTAMVQSLKGAKINHIWLVGCIVYQDTLNGPIRHTRVVLRSEYNSVRKTMSQPSLWESDAD